MARLWCTPYSRDNDAEALQAKVLTKDEARRINVSVARLPQLRISWIEGSTPDQ